MSLGAGAERFGCPKCLSVFRRGFPRCPLDGAVLQAVTDDPLIGHLLVERYRIEELLGEGGMGRVYLARHVRMSRRFAVKVLFGDLGADAKARARFSREADASSRLNHPNVLSVVDFGETKQGLLYLVMDYIEGEELNQLMAREGPLATDRVLSLLRQLVRGLSHAHGRGLVHRDFKPENVLVTHDGHEDLARIVDFGIAVVGEMVDPEQRLTTEGMVLGTPAYMSPEQSTGEELDQRSDLFSLGVMLYEMLCGQLPFDGSPLAMAKANLGARVPRIAERVPGIAVDVRLEAAALTLMAKDPRERFQSASDVLTHLDQVFGRAATQPGAVAASPATASPVAAVSPRRSAIYDNHTPLPPPMPGLGVLTGPIRVPDEIHWAADTEVDQPDARTASVSDGVPAAIVPGASARAPVPPPGQPLGATATASQAEAAPAEVDRKARDEQLLTFESQVLRRRWRMAGVAVLVTALVTGGALWLHYRGARRGAEAARAGEMASAAGVEADAGAAGLPAAAATAGDAAPAEAAASSGPEVGAPDAGPPAAQGHTPPGSRPPAHHTRSHHHHHTTSAATSTGADSSAAHQAAATHGGSSDTTASQGAQAGASQVVSPGEFDRRFRRVGKLLDRLASARGEAVTGPLRDSYFGVPYADAMRTESVRRDADRTLRHLTSRIEAELKRAGLR